MATRSFIKCIKLCFSSDQELELLPVSTEVSYRRPEVVEHEAQQENCMCLIPQHTMFLPSYVSTVFITNEASTHS